MASSLPLLRHLDPARIRRDFGVASGRVPVRRREGPRGDEAQGPKGRWPRPRQRRGDPRLRRPSEGVELLEDLPRARQRAQYTRGKRCGISGLGGAAPRRWLARTRRERSGRARGGQLARFRPRWIWRPPKCKPPPEANRGNAGLRLARRTARNPRLPTHTDGHQVIAGHRDAELSTNRSCKPMKSCLSCRRRSSSRPAARLRVGP
jgi:hypothetical protein